MVEDPELAKKILKTLVDRYATMTRLELMEPRKAEQLKKTYERLRTYWDHTLQGHNVPASLVTALEARGLTALGPLDHLKLLQGKTELELKSTLRDLSDRLRRSNQSAERVRLTKEIAALETYLNPAQALRPRSIPDLSRLSDQKKIEVFNEHAARLEGEARGMDEAIRKKINEVHAHARRHGLDFGSPVIQEKLERISREYIEPFKARRASDLNILKNMWDGIPRGVRNNIDSKSHYRYAVKGAGAGMSHALLNAARSDAKYALIMSASMFTINLCASDNPEEHLRQALDELFTAEMGKEILQLLADVLPFSGTLSMGYSVVTGEEFFTDDETSRWGSLGWGVVNLISDVAVVMSMGAATPVSVGAKILKIANSGGKFAKIAERLLVYWPRFSAIMSRIGVKRFADIVYDFMRNADNIAKVRRVELYAIGGMIAATAANLGVTYAIGGHKVEVPSEIGDISEPVTSSPESSSQGSAQINERLGALALERSAA